MVIINNRNRITTLKKLLSKIINLDDNIIILDNNSTYPELLDYYKELKDIKIYYYNNIGHKVLYKYLEDNYIKERYYFYTDSDIVPDCPDDFLDYLIESKKENKDFVKIGLSLKIDDLPDHYEFKKEVIKWEKQWWENKYKNFYISKIDTTFACYDTKGIESKKHVLQPCLRTDYPYLAKHEPWYINTNNLNYEEIYYIKNSNAKFISDDGKEKFVGMWTQKIKKNVIKML